MSYVDDSTLLKVIPTKDVRLNVAAEINADLCRIADWGKGDTLNLNLQSLILFVYLLNVMLMSILLYL